jgi:glycosyltransferase involved in cell wall biosynthesis
MEALSLAREALGPFRLVLAGHGTDGAECRALAGSFGLADELVGLGLRRDVEMLLPAADLFAFPSLPGIEAIAGSLLQAMAAGLPALASAVGGIPEYLHDGDTGWLAPPGDAQAWGKKLRALRAMPAADRQRVASAATEIVRERYAIEGTVRSYVELLTELGTR